MPLAHRRTVKAVKYNAKKAQQIGWASKYGQILPILGLTQGVRAEKFAEEVADWQASVGLLDDGKIGPGTWAKLEPLLDPDVAPVSVPAWLQPSWKRRLDFAPAPGIGGGPEWFRVAEAQRQGWIDELTGWNDVGMANDAESHTDWDEKYFLASPKWGDERHAAGVTPKIGTNPHWCAAFVNYCLHRAGYSHTGSAGANSFLKKRLWHFEARSKPEKGCIIVCGGDSASHVAFLAEHRGLPENPKGDVRMRRGMGYSLLGGNQRGGRVSIQAYDKKLFAAEDEDGNVSPYLWPKTGTGDCSIDLPSARRHFCKHQNI